MKAATLREQTQEELLQVQEDLRRQLLDLRVKKHVGDASEQPLRIREVRRDLARVNTVLRERQIAEAAKPQAAE